MNAKIAAAISLGASSLALFTMANVANAQTTDTPTTPTTTPTPVVQPVGEQGGSAGNQVNQGGTGTQSGTSQSNPADGNINDTSFNDEQKKANASAKRALEDAGTQADNAEKTVSEANNAVGQAQADADQAGKDAANANNKYAEAINEEKQAQTAKGQADKDVVTKQGELEKANKDVEEKTQTLNKAQAEKQTAEDTKKKAEEDKAKAEQDKTTAEGVVTEKNKDLTTKTQELKDKTQAKTNADQQLTQAEQAKTNAENQYKELDKTAKEKEGEAANAQKLADEKQAEVDAKSKELENANNNTTPAVAQKEAQEARAKANQAKKEAEQAKTESEEKAQEAQAAQTGIETAKAKVKEAENSLYSNEVHKKVDAAQLAIKNAKESASTADKAYTDAYTNKLDKNVEKGFGGFLDYVITKNSGESGNKNLLEDAQRAKKILNGERVEITKQVTEGNTTKNVVDRVIEAPMWYKDLVKLHRVGGADSLKNMEEAATYYDALNKLREEDSNANKDSGAGTLGKVNVRLSLIAEAIVNSFYSGANRNHAINHEIYGNHHSMDTHPYNSTENLAWGNYDGNDDIKHTHFDYGECKITNSGMGTCSSSDTSKADKKFNALHGWYTIEKTRYDKAVNEGKFVTYKMDSNNEPTDEKIEHKLTAEGQRILKEHRYDLGDFMQNHNVQLFESSDTTENLQGIFIESVGHYTNFANKNISAGGFAESDLHLTKTSANSQDVAVWHGSSESSISVDEFKSLLNAYKTSLGVTSSTVLEPTNADALKTLNAKANSANYKMFEAKYELRKVQYNFNMTPDDETNGLQDQDLVPLKKDAQKAQDNVNLVTNGKQKAEDFKKKYEEAGGENGNWTNKEKAKEDYQNAINYIAYANENLPSLNAELANANSAVSSAEANKTEADNKRKVYEGLLNDIDTAENGVTTATTKATQDQKAATEAATHAAELQEAYTKADKDATAAETAAREAQHLSDTQKQAKIQELTTALNGLKNELQNLQTTAQQKDADAKQARKDADAKKAKIDGDLTTAVSTAQNNVTAAQKAVQKATEAKSNAEEALKAAQKKVEDFSTKITGFDATIKSETQKSAAAQGRIATVQGELNNANNAKADAQSKLDTAKQTASAKATELAQAANAVKTAIDNVVAAKKTVAEAQTKVEQAKQTLAAAQSKFNEVKQKADASKSAFDAAIDKLPPAAKQQYTTMYAAVAGKFTRMQKELLQYVTTLDESVEALKLSAKKLNDVPIPQAPAPAPLPVPTPPAPSPAPAPSGDSDTTPGSGSGSSSSSDSGSSSNSSSSSDDSSSNSNYYNQYLAGYANNLFGNEQLGFNSVIPAAQSQSANGTNAQNANGVAANNVAGAAHANRIAAALAAAGAKAAAKDLAKAQDAAKDSAAKSESKQDNAKNDAKDSAKSESKSESKDDSKNAQASGGAQNAAQSASNSTTFKVVAAIAAVVAGIAAIGGGTYFARHRRA